MMMGWFFMVILAIAVVAALAWGGSAAGRTFWAHGDQDDKQRSALRILEERFASGEIDREEFERRREVLSGD
jgi:putative membrane protein